MKKTKFLAALLAASALGCGAGGGKAVQEAVAPVPAVLAAPGAEPLPPEWLRGFWQVGPAAGALRGKVFGAGDYIDVGKGGTFYAHSLAEMLRLGVYTGFEQKAAPGRYQIGYETPLGRISEIFSLETQEPENPAQAEGGRHIVYTYIKNDRKPYRLYLAEDSSQAVRNAFEQAGGIPGAGAVETTDPTDRKRE
ncbi:MAG: hypothetical protein LBT33_03770 [Spirochaetia bacterium]|jgi:hypothetical protein|nr:hypothetical protein [Spirochaetia bacterium]